MGTLIDGSASTIVPPTPSMVASSSSSSLLSATESKLSLQQQQTPADGATQSSATTPLPTILRLNQTVASGNVLPAAGSTEFHTVYTL